MTRIHFSSDPHFGHSNIIKYCNRPWESAEGMDEGLISNWNATVRPDDIVWWLGDIFFCEEVRAKEIMRRLNGKKFLIMGNHDKRIRNSPAVQALFDQIYPDLYETSIEGQPVVMSHYPMLSWNRAFRGAFMLHGHCHGSIAFDPKFRRMDVGVDCHGYAPVSWNEVKKKLSAVVPADARDR